MKKIFTIALAIGFMAGPVGAFAKKLINAPKANNEVYTWNKTGGGEPFIGTKSEAEDHFGCRGTYDQCAVGTPVNPVLPIETIYQH